MKITYFIRIDLFASVKARLKNNVKEHIASWKSTDKWLFFTDNGFVSESMCFF